MILTLDNLKQKKEILETVYENQNIKNQFISKFSSFNSVHIKPVILKNLQETIETLIRKNA